MSRWVAFLAALVAATASASIPTAEREALVALYNNHGGASWAHKENWLGAAGSECNWYGVECDDNDATVISLGLNANNLTGSFPVTILAQLPNLRNIDFSENNLTGVIPPEIGNLTSLQNLDVAVNQLSGTLPPQLGQITSLQRINFSSNRLTGPIPVELRALRNLEELGLYNNQLTGGLPRELADLVNLRILTLSSNLLEGTLPPELYQMTSLVEIYFGDNRFSGPIPPAIRNLTNLEVLAFWSNRFTGTIPAEITTMSRLRSLELQGNQLEGGIPGDIGNLTNLTWLDLAGNRLTGPIPASIGNLKKLTVFSVYENQLDGPIPPGLGSLSELEVLYLTSNRFTGTIPETFRNLKKMTTWYLADNRLTGPLPSWIGELTSLADVYFGTNQFSGPIPSQIGNLTNLTYLDLQENRLTGQIPAEIGNLKKLQYLSLSYNLLSGPIPAGIWQIEPLIVLLLSDGSLTGVVPREVGNLRNLENLSLQNNELEGEIPPELGNLSRLQFLNLWGNRLTGTIPKEIGNLKQLGFYDLSNNALVGPIPPEIMGLTAVRDSESDLSYNKLFTSDPAVRAFVNRKQYDGNFEQAQTVVPTNVRVVSTTDRSAVIEWTPISYYYDEGGYQVLASTTPGGPAVSVVTTETKEMSSVTVRNLAPSTTYFFSVSTVTHPHFYQKNLLVSPPAPPVSGTTGARVLAAADIDLTETTRGLVQIDGVAQNEDRFVLTNFGDVASVVTVTREGDFFTVEPAAFTLNAGASQTVTVRSVAKPPGTYYGHAVASGDGTGDGIVVGEVLLSVAKPAGTVRAEAVDARVEVAGAPGSDSVGQAKFRNVGTAPLSGIVLSDQPWVVPNPDPITIEPQQIGVVNFRVIRARRPPGAEGALSANLSLVYVDGSFAGASTPRIWPTGGGAGSVSVAKVTVVDVSKPALSAGTIPAFGAGEVAYFLSGIASFSRGGTSFVSDLSLLNSSGARAINDLRLYYTAAGSPDTTVATLTTIPSTQSVTLANVVTNVYGSASQAGSVQLRTSDWQNLVIQAKLLALTGAGTFAGDVPVFRSDRGVPAGLALYLAGVRKSATAHSDLYLQEVGGGSATARVEFLDANGAAVGTARTESMTPYGMIEILDAVPAGAATVIVTNGAGSSGRLAGYARVFDDTSGDTWSVVDWSRVQRFPLGDAVRVPFVNGPTASTPVPGGRRRAVGHAVDSRSTTDLTLFNPASADVRVTVEVFDNTGIASDREVVVGAGHTMTLSDVGAVSRSATAQAVVSPIRGQLVVTAHSSRTSVPIIAAANGLRVGQSQIFSNLEDSSAFRTSFGLVETSGRTAVVRARVFLDEGRGLASAAIYRDFSITPGQQIVEDQLVRAIVGPSRDTSLGDLHNVQLRIEILSGQGSVVPFVMITDVATGDSLMRLE